MPPSNRFPILRLPLAPLELVTKDLTPLDIFSLAVIKIQQNLSMKPMILNSLNFIIDNSSISPNFQVTLEQANGERWHISVKVIVVQGWPDLDNVFEIDQKQYKVLYEHAYLTIREKSTSSEPSKDAILSISKMVSRVFYSQKTVFQSREIAKESILPVIPSNFLNLHVLSLTHSTSQLTSDELSGILENFSFKNFELNWSVEEGFKYRKSLRYPYMTLRQATWLTIECLLNMECVWLMAYDVSLSIEDVKTFVRKWLEGGLEKLRYMQLSVRGFSWQSVMDDLEKKPLIVRQTDRQRNMILRLAARDGYGWEIGRNGKRAAVVANDKFIFEIL